MSWIKRTQQSALSKALERMEDAAPVAEMQKSQSLESLLSAVASDNGERYGADEFEAEDEPPPQIQVTVVPEAAADQVEPAVPAVAVSSREAPNADAHPTAPPTQVRPRDTQSTRGERGEQ